MKNYINRLVGLLVLTLAIPLSAQTVINYEDGSTYTLEEGEKIFITSGNLFGLTESEGSFSFGKRAPHAERDFTETETADDYPVGSEEWCELYVPWSEGYTFNMQLYIRTCPQWGEQ